MGSTEMDELDPFARLENTHRRIEERLVDLERAAGQADLSTIADVLGFFDRAGARHHEDEERSLFPPLRAVPHLASLLSELEAEHRAHDEARAELDRACGGGPGTASVGVAAAKLASVYRAHIAREERELFPAARAALDAPTQRAIAAEMTARRGGGGGGRGRNRR